MQWVAEPEMLLPALGLACESMSDEVSEEELSQGFLRVLVAVSALACEAV